MEYRFRRADGSYASVLDRGHVLRDETGKALRLIGAILDITERRRAEEALHEANQKLKDWVAELEQRNTEMSQLGEMGELLQTCTAADEAYDVVAHSARAAALPRRLRRPVRLPRLTQPGGARRLLG
jgi:hypothetical protein